jgi:DNA-binding transcriptional regulator YiaG
MPSGDYHKGKGKGVTWIRKHIGYCSDDCLPWPFAKDPHYGRGIFGLNGKVLWAHRYMCELVHGPAPDDRPQAAHSCGNGHLGCCNPRHLSWKTNSENQLDRVSHGRHEGGKGARTYLTPAQISEIRASKGVVTQLKLANKFGVKRGTIEYWQRHDREPKPFSDHPYNLSRRKSFGHQQLKQEG